MGVNPIPASFKTDMAKSLFAMTRAELITTIQDYQEMVGEIEHLINSQSNKSQHLLDIRDIIEKYLMGDNTKHT